MKKLITLSLILLLTLSIKVEAKNIAFIVAISYYDYIPGALSTDKDVVLIKQTLLNQGFMEENIFILQDEEATKQNIIETFNKFIANINTGDIAYFHFSGHGQQIKDFNGDEADGYDESLVCFDSWSEWSNGYLGEDHLIDDELDVLFTNLRTKIGKNGSFLVTIDACYSGTMCRENEKIRNNRGKIAPQDYHPPTIVTKSSGVDMKKNEKLCPMIVISASQQDEVNYETQTESGEGVGSLSYAFSKSFNGNNLQTYRGLFDNIKVSMAISVPRQTPLAEGELDTKLFGSRGVAKRTYFKVEKITDEGVIINVGKIAGIYEGTIVGFYPIDSQAFNNENCIVKAEVISSGDFTATVKLENEIPKDKILKSWVVVKNQSYGEMKVNVYLHENMKKRNSVKQGLKENTFIRFVDKDKIFTADIIVKDSVGKYGDKNLSFLVKNDNNQYLHKLDNENIEEKIKIIKSEILVFSKARYLKELVLFNPNINIELKLVPVESYELKGSAYVATKLGTVESKIENGQIRYYENDLFVFQVINKGVQTAYFQIANIQPNNNVEVLIPPENISPVDMKIAAKDTVTFDSYIMQISSPFGTDIFKVIASPDPLHDFREIVKNSSTRSGIPKSPFEILAENITTGTRSVKPLCVPTNTVNINSFIIKTEKK